MFFYNLYLAIFDLTNQMLKVAKVWQIRISFLTKYLIKYGMTYREWNFLYQLQIREVKLEKNKMKDFLFSSADIGNKLGSPNQIFSRGRKVFCNEQ